MLLEATVTNPDSTGFLNEALRPPGESADQPTMQLPGQPANQPADQPTPNGDLLFDARGIQLKGPWGVVFGPLDLQSTVGGVTVLQCPPGAARVALLLTLCGRMKLNGGDLTVLGYTNDHQQVFKSSAVAFLNEVDETAPSVTIRDLVTEQLRWGSSWWRWVPQANEDQVHNMLAYLFQDLPIPPMDSFVADLPEVEQALVRIAIANVNRPPLLVVGHLDYLPERSHREILMDRLVQLGQHQSVITANANAGEFVELEASTKPVEVPGLLEFMQRAHTASTVKDLDKQSPSQNPPTDSAPTQGANS